MSTSTESTPYRPGWATTPNLVWVTLWSNVVVILQGAFVRATGSGAGCGAHWPTCNGELIPVSGNVHTAIEFTHRLLSLVVLFLGTWLLRRVWRERHEHRGTFVFGLAAFVFLIIEAGLGALTVLWGLTGDNQSTARGLMVATHLVNSLLLVGALVGTVVYARRDRPSYPLRLAQQGPLLTVLLVGLIGMQVLMFSGGIAAMGNTMFPSESLAEGLAADLDPASHPLIRLRILHPLIAIAVGVYLFIALGLARWLKPVPQGHRLRQWLLGTYIVQLVVGTVNLALLAPIVLQMLHLGLAVAAFGLLASLSLVMLGAPIPAVSGAARFSRSGLERA
jgi:heme A synthase